MPRGRTAVVQVCARGGGLSDFAKRSQFPGFTFEMSGLEGLSGRLPEKGVVQIVHVHRFEVPPSVRHGEILYNYRSAEYRRFFGC